MAKKKKKKTKTQRLWGFLKFQMVLIVIVIAAIAYYYVGGYAAKIDALKLEAETLVQRSTEETFKESQTSIAYDCNGDTISVMKGEKDVYYVEYEDIPVYIRQAIVATEDKRFYEHNGVDYRGILRAIISAIQNGEITQGGSTITQQLARNIFLTNERTLERKIEEIFIAIELEKKYSKEEILEFYLNNIYFANGYYGIEAAAQGYFGKDINHLSLSEMVFLCAIPNNPTTYDPLTNYDNTIERRDRILGIMLDDQIISKTSYETAISETITLVETEEESYNYAETYTFYCATRALMEAQGFTFQTVFESDEEKEAYEKEYEELYNECNASLFTGGYRIYTSLDLTMQQQLQDCLDEGLASFTTVNDEGVYELQGAAVCIDNSTGMVRAIVGGREQEEIAGYTLNRAYQSFRQPGSAIKPLIVYTPAIQDLGYTADSIVVDEKFEGGPSNSDGVYLGEITLRTAVSLSRNTVAWQIFEELTPEYGISFLEAMGFSNLSENDKVLAASIGGFTNGVSALEMAKAYATIANDGAYRNPSCITKITDAQGNVIYQADQTETIIYKENAARQMTDILETVMTSGTGSSYALDGMPCAGKTGTTNDNKDGWFCGYTAYYTTAVWVGYDIPQKVEGLSGATYPGRIWYNFMTQIHEDLSPVDFVAPITNVDTSGGSAITEEETKSDETDETAESDDTGETDDVDAESDETDEAAESDDAEETAESDETETTEENLDENVNTEETAE